MPLSHASSSAAAAGSGGGSGGGGGGRNDKNNHDDVRITEHHRHHHDDDDDDEDEGDGIKSGAITDDVDDETATDVDESPKTFPQIVRPLSLLLTLLLLQRN